MKAVRIFLVLLAVMCLAASVGAAPYKLRISHQLPDSHHIGLNVKEFKSLVEQKTEGKIEVEV